MNNKVLIKLDLPIIEEHYDLWIPINSSVYRVTNLIVKAVKELTVGWYNPQELPLLYDKTTARLYDVNKTVKENKIRNGTEIIMI